MNMYNYFLKARVSLRTLSSLVINLFTQVAVVLELALVSSQEAGPQCGEGRVSSQAVKSHKTFQI
jgi:hypothetical protein